MAAKRWVIGGGQMLAGYTFQPLANLLEQAEVVNMVKRWSNSNQMVVKWWSNSGGRMVEELRSNDGQTAVKRRLNGGQTAPTRPPAGRGGQLMAK